MPKKKAHSAILMHSDRMEGLHQRLLSILRSHLIPSPHEKAIDDLRDISEIRMVSKNGYYEYHGLFNDTKRMHLEVMFDESNSICHTLIVLTHGNKEAELSHITRDNETVEKSEKGNRFLLCRLLHVGIFFLKKAGVRKFVVHPTSNSRRRLYRMMGFLDGKTLDLEQLACLEKAFGYIKQIYISHGHDLDLTPPLPL